MPETLVIFTCQQESETLCLNELMKAGRDVRFVRWLDRGVGMLACTDAFAAFSGTVRETGVIFARHLFPADYELGCEDTGRQDAGCQADNSPLCEESRAALGEMAARMRKDQPFGVQLRGKPGEALKQLPEMRRAVVSFFENHGFVEQVKQPAQIVSGYLAGDRLYMGFSAARDNLSDWPGGMRAYAVREDTVSRAEFKLLEAIEMFDIPMRPDWTAVDLGAAPGGWTKVLLERGMHVIAVDPAELAPAVAAHPNVRYIRGLAQAFIKDNKLKLDLAVNDMKMDAAESAGIMSDLARQIRPGGLIVLTLKLYKTDKTATIRKAIYRLRDGYEIIGARQLFHNRSEVTVVARRKG